MSTTLKRRCKSTSTNDQGATNSAAAAKSLEANRECHVCQRTSCALFGFACCCTVPRYLCDGCLRGMLKAKPELKCALCRAPVSSLTKGIQVAELIAKRVQRSGPNVGVEEDDFRYRWAVDYVAGVRGTSPQNVEFLLQWKSTGLGRRAPKATWQSAADVDADAVRAFLRKHGFVDFRSSEFAYPVLFTVPLHKVSRAKDQLLYKCSAAGCNYTSKKRSNMQSHELTQHAPPHQTKMRWPCPMCKSTFGLEGAMTKRLKKFHLAKPAQL